MSPFDILQYYPSLDAELPPPKWPCDTDITFYFQPATAPKNMTTASSSSGGNHSAAPSAAVLYMHIVSPIDTVAILHHCASRQETDNVEDANKETEANSDMNNERNILTLSAWARCRNARLLLLAVQLCHIVVLSEPTGTFDASQLPVFKALRTIRDKCVVPLLPAVLRQLASVGDGSAAAADDDEPKQQHPMSGGRDVRLCSPRFLFYFERSASGFGNADDVKQLEFDVEDKIYKMLRHEFVITNNSAASLFSIPRNKRFVYINNQNVPQAATAAAASGDSDWMLNGGNSHCGSADAAGSDDPLLDSLSMLDEFIEASSRDRRSAGGSEANSEYDDIRPYRVCSQMIYYCRLCRNNKVIICLGRDSQSH